MGGNLRRDYEGMSRMIFGEIVPIDNVRAAIADLEERINQSLSIDITAIRAQATESGQHWLRADA
jgi:hypothetical protein